MNRALFFAAIRSAPFPGSMGQSQVSGVSAILDEWDRRRLTDRRWLAYMLATAFHETARTMQPITEYGNVAYFDKYDAGTKLGKTLGNTEKGDGYRFRGRGYVQLTGRANYVRAGKALGVDMIRIPDKALDPALAASIMFAGMTEGWFTGKKLSDYFSASTTDWVNARRIINGVDKAALIARFAEDFHDAIVAASTCDTETRDAPPAPSVPDAPIPPPVRPVPPSGPVSPAAAGTAATGLGLAALIGLIYALWDQINAFLSYLF